MFLPFLLTLVFAGGGLAAADPALVEFVPEGVTPKAEQRAIVAELASKVFLCKVGYDEAGNVRSLEVGNHGAFVPKDLEDKEAYMATKPGLDDATFAKVAGLPELKALRLLKQPLSDEAYAVLQTWPDLEAFLIEGHIGSNTADFMMYLNDLQNLRWLELKHLFGLDATRVDELQGFPKLERLELDNRSAGPECVAFLQRCPNIRDFEIHRTTLNNAQIAQITEALPKLERFDIKPSGQNLDSGCLPALQTLENLRVLVLNRWKPEQYFWENGIAALVDVPSLKHLGATWDDPAIVQLREARPDIVELDGRQYAVTFDYKALD